MPQINTAGLALIKACEGFRAYPYRDGHGVRTIGYGHTKGVTAFTTPITEGEAEELLNADLAEAQTCVERLVTAPLNDNQYAALVSLTFNAGPAPLEKTLGRLLAAGRYDQAADEFQKWNHSGGVELPGLVRRRAMERALFLTPIS